MMVMCGQSNPAWHWLAGKYPGRIGGLRSPGCWRLPHPWIPYALDNGAFTGFDEAAFLQTIEKARLTIDPIWIVVPDTVGNRGETLKLWDEWEPRLRPLGWPLTMVMQDGMTPDDFRGDIAFIGGTTEWKWRNLRDWSGLRFHVGRVNTERHLWQCHDAGAESCDGSGWFRAPDERLPGLLRYLERTTNGQPQHDTPNLFPTP